MPEIKQLDWSNLQPVSNKIKPPDNQSFITKDKQKPKPQKPRKKKLKAIDKRIWSTVYDQDQHLKSIRYN